MTAPKCGFPSQPILISLYGVPVRDDSFMAGRWKSEKSSKSAARTLVALFCFASQLPADTVTYRVTEGATGCHEVKVPRWTEPKEMVLNLASLLSGHCEYEIRSPGETTLYITLICKYPATTWRMPEKYAVDLLRPKAIHQIHDSLWDSAFAFQRTSRTVDPKEGEPGIRYAQHLLDRTGTHWNGLGVPLPSSVSPTGNRIAVNSWDGVDVGDLFTAHHRGSYWLDIYDTVSGGPLARVQGTFNGSGISPHGILGPGAAAWYTDQFYIVPLEPEGMRRILVCDLDAASGKDRTGLKRRK